MVLPNRFMSLYSIYGLLMIVLGTLGQRYYNCDPMCTSSCSESDDSEPICSYIKDVTLLRVNFRSRCHFECANKCYSNMLTVNNMGDCEGFPPTSSEEAEAKARKREAVWAHFSEVDVEYN